MTPRWSARQVQQYEGIMAADKLLYGRNARPVQPLNGRTINYCDFPASSKPARRTYSAPTCPAAAKTQSLLEVMPIRHHHHLKPASMRLASRSMPQP